MILPVGAAVSGSGLLLQPLDIRIKRKKKKIQAESFLFCALVIVYSLITKPKPTQRWLFYAPQPRIIQIPKFSLAYSFSIHMQTSVCQTDYQEVQTHIRNLYVIARQQLTLLSMVFPLLHLFLIDMLDDISAIKGNLYHSWHMLL